jgi:hypothetical protein
MSRRLLLLALPLAVALGATSNAAADEELPLLPPLPKSAALERGLHSTQHGGPVRTDPLFRSGFVTDTKGPYEVGVSTYGSGLFLEVWRGGKKQRTATAYLARGVARPKRLQATFGKFGKVSMRFHRVRSRRVTKHCLFGRLLVKQHGVFVGSLRFRGEGGYVSVRIHRAKGGILRVGKRCHVRHHRSFSPAELEALFAEPDAAMLSTSREGVNSTALLAIDAGKRSAFFAIDEETRAKLAIIRLAVVHRPGRVQINESITSGTVAPPAPFHGTGRYNAFPDGSTAWSGGLSVNFPGAPRFPLTGPSFETLLEVPF